MINRRYELILPVILCHSYRGFQEVLDGYGTLSAREKYRAYMSLATKVFGKDRTPTLLQVSEQDILRALS